MDTVIGEALPAKIHVRGGRVLVQRIRRNGIGEADKKPCTIAKQHHCAIWRKGKASSRTLQQRADAAPQLRLCIDIWLGALPLHHERHLSDLLRLRTGHKTPTQDA
jgi:hypothetical protein